MKYIISFLLVVCCLFHKGLAQSEFIFRGIISDKAGDFPLEFATVKISDALTKEMIKGGNTDIDGKFELSTNRSDIVFEISFLGYQSKIITNAYKGQVITDMGKIYLDENKTMLEEIVVQAEKSSTEFKLDKRVFNVGKDLSTTGASAMEVLNNVPSVNVSIEGQISLRGSRGVQILINGKPSVIANEGGKALGTITADMIEKIEVITNPSAKYEAEGTSGIINIVLKKEERKGMNGSVTFNTGWPQNHSVGLSINKRTENFNIFSQFGGGYRVQPSLNEAININKSNNTSIISDGKEFRNERFLNFVLGTDYYINKFNIITLSGNVAYEAEDQPSESNFNQLNAQNQSLAKWKRNEVTTAGNPKYQYELQYKKSFADSKDHTLIMSAIGNFFGKDQTSVFENTVVSGVIPVPKNQTTATNFNEGRYTLSADYVKPYGDNWTVEGGAQYVLNDVGNDFEVRDEVNGSYVVNANLTNNFEFTQNVLGVYTTSAYEGKMWGLKLGLRAENTYLATRLENAATNADPRYYTNWFPTLHTSYKLTPSMSVQGGYSKRIYRPRLWDLNPFFNIRNNFSIRAGNPNLQPEFTDSYEVGSIYIAEKGSINFGMFYRLTSEVIERIVTFENNVSTELPFNLGRNRTAGLEINGKYTVSKKMDLAGDFNYNYFSRDGVLDAKDFDFSAGQYGGKLTSKIKLPYQIDFEVTGQYESKVKTVQSIISDNLYADFGLRKKMLKGRAVFSLSVRDVFASRIRESIADQSNFYVYNWGQRGRFISAGFSYGFGKGEAMEFSARGGGGGRR